MLDAGPLGLAASPARTPGALACQAWLARLDAASIPVYVSEVADYEVRRELLRASKTASITNLDRLKQRVQYVPITTAAMLLAAELWATARQRGQPTASDASLDADVILAAQALMLAVPGLVVATSNPGHLNRFVPSALWPQIAP